MNEKLLRLYRYELPFRQPLRLGSNIYTSRQGLLIRYNDEHVQYWGETAPLPGFSQETFEDARTQLVQMLSGGQTGVLQRIFDRPNGLFPSVEFGLESILMRLNDRPNDERMEFNPVQKSPGQALISKVRINGLLMGDGEELANRAIELARNGYLAVKLKVGGRAIAEDIERIHLVRKACGPDMEIRADANRAWEIEEAIEFCEGIVDARISYLEEPLRQPENTSILARTGVPLAMDETTREIMVDEANPFDGLAAVVLKPMLLGYTATGNWISWAHRHHVTPVITGSFESGCGIASLVQLVAHYGLHETPSGFDTLSWFAEDTLCEPLSIVNGIMELDAVRKHSEQVDERRLIEEPL